MMTNTSGINAAIKEMTDEKERLFSKAKPPANRISLSMME